MHGVDSLDHILIKSDDKWQPEAPHHPQSTPLLLPTPQAGTNFAFPRRVARQVVPDAAGNGAVARAQSAEPDISLRCEFPGWRAGDSREVSVVAAQPSCF